MSGGEVLLWNSLMPACRGRGLMHNPEYVLNPMADSLALLGDASLVDGPHASLSREELKHYPGCVYLD